MSANFYPALTRPTDRARARLGDTGPAYILQDETYASVLGSSVTNAGLAELADMIGAHYIRLESSGSFGDQKVDFRGRAKAYADLAKQLRLEIDPGSSSSSDSLGGRMEESCYIPM